MGYESNNETMDNTPLEKSKSHLIVGVIEYMTDTILIKTIIKKSTGNISIMSFDSDEVLIERTYAFDSYAQIVEGSAEVVIDKESHMLNSGQGIIIPAHSPNLIKAHDRFKMIFTIIKSGYE
jgi:quercetin dioxygenase-like cupin family protein